jgi:hypothetical protein
MVSLRNASNVFQYRLIILQARTALRHQSDVLSLQAGVAVPVDSGAKIYRVMT